RTRAQAALADALDRGDHLGPRSERRSDQGHELAGVEREAGAIGLRFEGDDELVDGQLAPLQRRPGTLFATAPDQGPQRSLREIVVVVVFVERLERRRKYHPTQVEDHRAKAHGSMSTPGLSTPAGSSTRLAARNASAKGSGRWRSYQGRWSRPTA